VGGGGGVGVDEREVNMVVMSVKTRITKRRILQRHSESYLEEFESDVGKKVRSSPAVLLQMGHLLFCKGNASAQAAHIDMCRHG